MYTSSFIVKNYRYMYFPAYSFAAVCDSIISRGMTPPARTTRAKESTFNKVRALAGGGGDHVTLRGCNCE